jgi:shikimate kinase
MLERGGAGHMSSLQPRIHIVGAPSAGKSTLGRRLAGFLGCPCYDLDPIAYVDDR